VDSIYKKSSKGHNGNNWKVTSSSSMMHTVHNKQQDHLAHGETEFITESPYIRQFHFIKCPYVYKGVSKDADEWDATDRCRFSKILEQASTPN